MGTSQNGWPYRAVAETAGRQETMITRGQLIELGVAPRSVSNAAAVGRLYRVHQAVYSIAPPGVRPRLAPEHAALLACDHGSVISHWSAAWLHGLSERQPPIVELTVVGERGRRRIGLVVHRAATVNRVDLTRVGRLPCTTVARTLIDISPTVGDEQLEPLVDRALRLTSRNTMLSALERAGHRPGTGRLRALLDPERPSAEAWSRAERRLLKLIQASGLPLPEGNVTLGDRGRIPDLMWRSQRVIVEYDSWDYHSGPAAFHADRERHNQLTAQGYQVLHVTYRVLRDHPEQILVWVARALGRSEG
ncbi:MAG TPA: hypothetical protein VMF07_22075 [Solirubrobacteraceae bacterium]|nr:hypothetical protein [Solirubrobacteraceae bacterium]